ncbi:MAG: hypothetical protein IJ113_06100 [Eggerthellaceae bacterium]|nr:hypothetical protein [Eggerthellaceae bacterium]
MGDCKCVSAKVSVSGDIHATVSCDGTTHGTVSVGTVTIRDGTNDYERLVHKPSIEGHTLTGDSTIDQIGVGTLTVQDIEKILYRID